MKAAEKKALDTIKAVVDDDGLMTINRRDYKVTKMNHRQRRRIFAFYSTHSAEILKGDFGFMDSDEWDGIESFLNDKTLGGPDMMQLSKQPEYWDRNAGDYLKFVSTALPVICYPFLVAGPTN